MEKRVLKILEDLDKNIPAYNGENLFDAGLLDSFQVIDLVSALEDAFEIEIDPEEVVVENFATPRAIVAFMRRILE